jgi:hypothetical protein
MKQLGPFRKQTRVKGRKNKTPGDAIINEGKSQITRYL